MMLCFLSFWFYVFFVGGRLPLPCADHNSYYHVYMFYFIRRLYENKVQLRVESYEHVGVIGVNIWTAFQFSFPRVRRCGNAKRALSASSKPLEHRCGSCSSASQQLWYASSAFSEPLKHRCGSCFSTSVSSEPWWRASSASLKPLNRRCGLWFSTSVYSDLLWHVFPPHPCHRIHSDPLKH